ncbi:glycosyltransferase family 25 protein [Ruegeria arenilitoris]|uniref:glycosyltransferase family 25 protein n=1 Tax=Ruegeria arenilitoris TaxID=1173585 RepID=UPI00148030EE|nr:glycosyltransferase family 25 protein [Ruegeria arenilitoris]
MTRSTGLGIFEGIVDRVIVLSLPKATERRERLPQHLAEFGITCFDWHDAFSPEDPEVQELYDMDLVADFPPCFRCGKERCDCENNVLIPTQVANFASHLDIWQRTSQSRERVLVMEDDIVLHPWAARVARKLRKRIDAGKIPLRPETPMLLRLGWAKSREHHPYRWFRAVPKAHMANPCYAITPAFAQKLLDRFSRIDTTSDIFLHDQVADRSDSLSIYPPIASELSWSEGSLDSHIHPKENRLEFLKKNKMDSEREVHERRLRQHVRRVFNLPVLCVGHPRTGTGFVAELCTKAGLDIGHEMGGADGISSWMFAVDAPENPWALDPVANTRRALRWQVMIQTVRDPVKAVPSIMRENRHAPASYEFRREHIKKETGFDLNGFDAEIERAIASLCLWARIIRAQDPDFVFRIEHDANALIAFLAAKGFDVTAPKADLGPVNAEKLYKGVHYEKPRVDNGVWGNLSPQVSDMLAEYCSHYGYDNPAAQPET